MTNFTPNKMTDASGRIAVRWSTPTSFTITSTHPEVPSGTITYKTEPEAAAFWLAFCLN